MVINEANSLDKVNNKVSNIDNLQSHFLLLQVNDSLFPIGAYSHSYGLETYIQKDIVHDTATATEYIKKRLLYNFLYTDLLATRLAFDYTKANDLAKLNELEDIMEASRIPLELREASKKLGSRFIKTLTHMDVPYEQEHFKKYLALRKGKTTCHPCAYGVFCACTKINREEALTNYLYAQASAMVTNCVKTIPLSQSDGQKILFSLYPTFADILNTISTADEEMLCLSTPGFDFRSIQHEYLYSRLYMS